MYSSFLFICFLVHVVETHYLVSYIGSCINKSTLTLFFTNSALGIACTCISFSNHFHLRTVKVSMWSLLTAKMQFAQPIMYVLPRICGITILCSYIPIPQSVNTKECQQKIQPGSLCSTAWRASCQFLTLMKDNLWGIWGQIPRPHRN